MTDNQKIGQLARERRQAAERKQFAFLDRLQAANQSAVDDPQGWIDGLLEIEEVLG